MIAQSLSAGPAELDIRDLGDSDLATPRVQIDVTRTIDQPWSLDFASTGRALVTGMVTDNVAILAPPSDLEPVRSITGRDNLGTGLFALGGDGPFSRLSARQIAGSASPSVP